MMSQQFETMCKLFEDAVKKGNMLTLTNLAAKSAILRKRNDKSQSVVRELTTIRKQKGN